MTLRPVLLACVCLLAVSACDKSGKGKLAAAPGDATAAAPALGPDGKPLPGKDKPKESAANELLDKLSVAKTTEQAAAIEKDVWDAWLVSGSATVDILMKRGVEAQEHDEKDLARDMYDRAIMLKPEYAEGWNRRALLFFNDGKYDEAMADIEAALTYEPRHFGAWIGLGMIFESIDKPEAALKAYRKALAIHPWAEAARAGEKRLIVQVEGRQL